MRRARLDDIHDRLDGRDVSEHELVGIAIVVARPTSSLGSPVWGSTAAAQHLEPQDLAGEHAVLDHGICAGIEDQVDQIRDLGCDGLRYGEATDATAGTSVATLGDPHERRLTEERGPSRHDSGRGRGNNHLEPLGPVLLGPGERRTERPDAEVLSRGTTPCRPRPRPAPPANRLRRAHADESTQLRGVQGVALRARLRRRSDYFLAVLRLPYRRSKRSTRPPVSTSFCLPV